MQEPLLASNTFSAPLRAKIIWLHSTSSTININALKSICNHQPPRNSALPTSTSLSSLGHVPMLRTSNPGTWNCGNTKRPTISAEQDGGAHTAAAAGIGTSAPQECTRHKYCSTLKRILYLKQVWRSVQL